MTYNNGKIYKLTSDKSDKVYVGCTIQSLQTRLKGHKASFKRNQKNNSCSSKLLFELGEVKIELIELYPCNTKAELEAREQYYIRLYGDNCVNQLKKKTVEEKKKKKAEYLKTYKTREVCCEFCKQSVLFKDQIEHIRNSHPEKSGTLYFRGTIAYVL